MELINRTNPIIAAVVGLILGLILGMILFWWLFPVKWTDAHSYDLSAEAKAKESAFQYPLAMLEYADAIDILRRELEAKMPDKLATSQLNIIIEQSYLFSDQGKVRTKVVISWCDP